MNRSSLAVFLWILAAAVSLSARADADLADPLQISGILTVQFGDYAPGSGIPSRRLLSLHTDAGETLLLEPGSGVSPLPKGLHEYLGKRVTVAGRMQAAPSGVAKSVARRFVVSDAVRIEPNAAPDLARPKYSDPTPVARPFVSLLCKFADDPAQPQPVSYFTTQLGNAFPGFDHYMREASYGKTTLAGGRAFGWFTLPQPRSFYVPANPTNEQSQQMLTKLANDCSAVAKASVDFTPFFGINFMFNGQLDSAAWGGQSVLNLTAAGERAWPSTWMPYRQDEFSRFGWNAHGILAHEMSHAFGASHSQTPDGNEYGSSWDVVSSPGDNCLPEFTDAAYGCVGQSMNGYAKVSMDFLPDSRIAIYALGSGAQTYQIEQLAQATANANPLLVRIPIAGTDTRFYTVEVRRRVSYDRKLRAEGVVIHQIDTGRDNPAEVVPADPQDPGGAAWTVGSAYQNSVDNIVIRVVAATATGFTVRVEPFPAGATALSVTKTAGTGTGTVVSSPTGINCGTTCTAAYATGTVVSLTATPSAVSTFAGWSGACSGTGACQVTMSAAKTVTATFNDPGTPTFNLGVSVAGSGAVTSRPAGINCGTTCAASFTPGTSVTLTAAAGANSTFAGWGGSCTGTAATCIVAMDAAKSVTATFGAVATFDTNVRTVVTGYYQTILGRTADQAGLDFWAAEATRVKALGADVREVFFAMSMAFFASSEYAGKNVTDTQFITDLYRTFFGRAPDAAGLAYWRGELTAAGSKSALLNSFLFSAEFSIQMTTLFGSTGVRPEVTLAIDLFRGVFGRLPDSAGFNFWLGRVRAAQCQGAAEVAAEVNNIAGQFFNSTEYLGRARSDRDFVGDVYNAYLRRGPGGDTAGFNYWIGQVPALGRDGIRAQFVPSAEFQNRVNAVFSAGCLQ